jgi:DNA-binding NtrC family response regulator
MVATVDTLLQGSESQVAVRGSLPLADRPQRVRRQSRRAPATSNVCLVVSPDPLRQMMFGQSAARNGWKQVVCADQALALQHLASGTVGMVLVDTVTPNPNTAADRRLLVELLSDQKEVLTVVCGRTNDTEEEVWARQCGVWMYLPGVAPESDLNPVLNGAKEVVERMRQRASFAMAGTRRAFGI